MNFTVIREQAYPLPGYPKPQRERHSHHDRSTLKRLHHGLRAQADESLIRPEDSSLRPTPAFHQGDQGGIRHA